MEFARVDAQNDAEFNAWFGVLERSEFARDHGRRGGWLPSEWRARALDDGAPVYHELYSYGDPGHPVAISSLEVSRADNLDLVRGELFVDPARRREGHGSRALAHLEDRSRELERQALLFWVMEGVHERGSGPNRTFAPQHGYSVIEESVERELDWPRPAGELERRTSEFLPSASGYEILSWRGAAPEELLAGRAHLSAIMPVEIPDSGYGIEEERWDGERVRHHERRTHEMGRDLLVSVARHRLSGELVGYSELTVSRERPGTAYQWDTLVVRAHRGHRLGVLMKIATMRELENGGYMTHRIMTSNNSLNTAMIAINESLGYYPTGGIVTWHKPLDH
jgi:GNAT superfamily N-acetyltransferase/RimJ/RimL family protein N-acetyltransferase